MSQINVESVAEELNLPVIESERLLLRMCLPIEAEMVLSYHERNREHLKPFYPVYSVDFFTEVYWQEQLALNLEEFSNDQSLRLFIFKKDSQNEVIGTANFSGFVRRAAQYCVLGYGIGHAFEGKGYMTEALESAIEFVFEHLNLHRVMANYIPTNERSGKVLKKLGFQVEGYARDYLNLDGHWQDHILTAKVNSKWRSDWQGYSQK